MRRLATPSFPLWFPVALGVAVLGCGRSTPPPALAQSNGREEAVRAVAEIEDTLRRELADILSADAASWRRPDFEYYRWKPHPQILIFDTISYAVQSRLFKRLAFYVEKTGYVGTMQDFDAISELHGFNAYDYCARDLAAFFTTAKQRNTTLLPEEIELRRILISHGCIRESGDTYAPVGGAVVSISRSSSPQLRRQFITHETLHGLFFTQPAFRAACFEIWDAVAEEQRVYFRLYFSWPDWSYDTTNRTLMVNEFMAYHLQFRRDQIDPYFMERGVAWLRERFPDESVLLDHITNDLPDLFLQSYDRLNEALLAHCGMEGGRLAGVAEP